MDRELEDQLVGVLEQDGLTMATPHGISRRAQRVKHSRMDTRAVPQTFIETESFAVSDQIAELDMGLIETLASQCLGFSGGDSLPVNIAQKQSRQSAYVLSLRGVPVESGAYLEERDFVYPSLINEYLPEFNVQSSGIYGMITQDLVLDGYNPHLFAEQFTPSTFNVRRSILKGPVSNMVRFVRVLAYDVTSVFQRLEMMEKRMARSTSHAADELRDSVAVIEVPRLSRIKLLGGFVGLLLVITLPANAVMLYRSVWGVKQAAEQSGQAAIEELMSAQGSEGADLSLDSLQRASTRFREADAILNQSSALAIGLASFVPDQYRSAKALLEVGDKTSEAARLFALGFEKIFDEPDRRLDERLDVMAAYARGVLPLLSDAGRAAASVDIDTLPEDKREQFIVLAGNLDMAIQSVREFAGLADFLTALIGKEHPRTYLLLFQNQTELRPSGGFIGSVAEITLDRGKITKLYVPPGGSYDLKGQLIENVASPKPLHLINPLWQFQDANWFADFPTTAEKVRWFWSKSGQPTVNGVIAVNASFMEKVLGVTGPINMPEYGKVIDQSNFLIETQKAVEIEYDKDANTPKKFIGDLSEALMERMKHFDKEDWLKIVSLISESLDTKDVQVALVDPEEEAEVERYGWNGRIKPTTGDALAIIESNIAGQKTDGVISETVEHLAEVQLDGSIIDQIKLTRTHNGIKGEMFSGVRNVSYVRVYVPLGSKLIKANGFNPPPANLFKYPEEFYKQDESLVATEDSMYKHVSGADISEESDRAVFGGWLQLDPGKTQEVVFQYKLPFGLSDIYSQLEVSPETENDSMDRSAYTLLLTSQSGKTTREVTSTLKIPNGWKVSWSRGGSEEDAASLSYNGIWDRDRVMAALLTREH